MSFSQSAVLALADGTVFHGESIGVAGHTVGEVVFNTALTGYQEILTDPSYLRQIVTLTASHIGNTGINDEDIESSRIQVAGLVIRALSLVASNFRQQQSLASYLCAQGIVAITEIDTRYLTRILRTRGAQNGCIMAAVAGQSLDSAKAIEMARTFPGLQNMNLIEQSSTTCAYEWKQTEWQPNTGYGEYMSLRHSDHVVAIDYGIKFNTLRMLAHRGCKLTVLPAQASVAEILALKPDGIFLSNGPGDPQVYTDAIDTIRELIAQNLPIFGLCLGHQLIALAVGARIIKMKTGHHGANHPVRDLDTGRVFITSQNHGFAVDAKTLPGNARVTHLSLFDNSLQGFALTDRPVSGFQGHPEASPGPHDASILFDRFVWQMQQR